MKVFDPFLGFRKTRFPIHTDISPIKDLNVPDLLSFPISANEKSQCSCLVTTGDEVHPGQPLWEVESEQCTLSPVKGKIRNIVNVPDIRRNRTVSSIMIDQSKENTTPAVFEPLILDKASASDLQQRIKDAGIMTDHLPPKSLDGVFDQTGQNINTLVVMAIDREPGISVQSQLFRERTEDAVTAVNLLSKVFDLQKVYIALPPSIEKAAVAMCQKANLDILPVTPSYAACLDSTIKARTGTGDQTEIISLETALNTLDAIQRGQLPDKKVLTIIGADNVPQGNYRVTIGTQFKDIFSQLGLKPNDKDKVVAGGPMKGFAQYSLEGSVDSGVNALMLIPESSIVPWSEDPCINCGKCIEICPVNLQVQMICRYAEFELFESAEELEVDACIECGMCASVCTARRPLTQLIELAKNEIAKANVVPSENETTNIPTSSLQGTNEPAIIAFQNVPKFTVGFFPHWRTGTSITRMNLAFILALIPAILLSAGAQFYGPQDGGLNSAFGPVSGFLQGTLVEMGLSVGFLWFSGVLGKVMFCMGLGLLVEYICQVVMRQPYHATNGHGALMGLIVALLMPPTVPLWILFVCVVITIFIGKQIFGGIGGYPMHPAVIGWLVILLSWPRYIYPIGTSSLAAMNTAVVIAIIIGGLALCLSGYIRFEIPLGVVIGAVVFYFVFQNRLNGDLGDQLLTGHLFLAAFFLSTDSTSSPANKLAMFIYGLGTGTMIMLIRAFGIWPDAVPFAILLMNVVYPLIDRLTPAVKKGAI